MQLVTLDELKKLASNDNVQEASQKLAYGLSFKDACKAYDNKKDELKKALDDGFNALWRKKAYTWLKDDYLSKKCPPIMLVGVGSSRTAYACLGGKCLKVAMNEAGAAQNKQEYKHTFKKHWWTTSYACFAQTYGSNDDYGLLMSECCAKLSQPSDLLDSLGMNEIEVLKAVVKAISDDKGHNLMSASTRLEVMATDLKKKGEDGFTAMFKYASAAEEGARWLHELQAKNASKMTPGEKSFVELVKFWKKNGIDELLPGDVMNEENWGFAIRDGKIAPVMLDVGFSKHVADIFYRN